MYNIMSTTYHQNYRDCFDEVRSRSELDRLKEKCCEKCLFRKIKTCGLRTCKFEEDYKEYREIIDDIRKPKIVYVTASQPDIFIHTREYKIKPKVQCKRTVAAQITKYQKHYEGTNQQLAFIQELVNKENFKRARIHAARGGFDKIVETLDKFINSKLGANNSENI